VAVQEETSTAVEKFALSEITTNLQSPSSQILCCAFITTATVKQSSGPAVDRANRTHWQAKS
jgi:hypothetical protein